MALPMFAPKTSASAAAGVIKCAYASDIMRSTLATLECTAQVMTAARMTQSTGSPVIAPMSTRTPGAFSAGASVSSRIWRQQHQAQADRDAPEILEAGAGPAAEGNQTQNKED